MGADQTGLVLSSPVALAVGSFTIGFLDRIDLENGVMSGDDAVELKSSSDVLFYEFATAGTKVSWPGSGTATLSSGTLASVFKNGSYAGQIDGGNFVVNVAVPEPSAFALAALAALPCGGAIWIKRKKMGRTIAGEEKATNDPRRRSWNDPSSLRDLRDSMRDESLLTR